MIGGRTRPLALPATTEGMGKERAAKVRVGKQRGSIRGFNARW